jgi:hypothetical protein
MDQRRDEFREGGEMSAEAAPLQALGNRTFDQRATPFENEGPPGAALTPKTPPTRHIFAGLAAFGVWLDLAAAKPPIL